MHWTVTAANTRGSTHRQYGTNPAALAPAIRTAMILIGRRDAEGAVIVCNPNSGPVLSWYHARFAPAHAWHLMHPSHLPAGIAADALAADAAPRI